MAFFCCCTPSGCTPYQDYTDAFPGPSFESNWFYVAGLWSISSGRARFYGKIGKSLVANSGLTRCLTVPDASSSVNVRWDAKIWVLQNDNPNPPQSSIVGFGLYPGFSAFTYVLAVPGHPSGDIYYSIQEDPSGIRSGLFTPTGGFVNGDKLGIHFQGFSDSNWTVDILLNDTIEHTETNVALKRGVGTARTELNCSCWVKRELGPALTDEFQEGEFDDFVIDVT